MELFVPLFTAAFNDSVQVRAPVTQTQNLFRHFISFQATELFTDTALTKLICHRVALEVRLSVRFIIHMREYDFRGDDATQSTAPEDSAVCGVVCSCHGRSGKGAGI